MAGNFDRAIMQAVKENSKAKPKKKKAPTPNLADNDTHLVPEDQGDVIPFPKKIEKEPMIENPEMDEIIKLLKGVTKRKQSWF